MSKKTKFEVHCSLNYMIKADSEEEALDKAESLLVQELENNHFGVTEIFNFSIHKRFENERL